MVSHDTRKNISKSIFIVLAFAYSAIASADISITGPAIGDTFYTDENTISVDGVTSGNVSYVSWRCESGCNGSGTTSGVSSWSTGTIYINSGTNLVSITAHNADGSTDTATINLTRTIPGGVQVTFPYQLNFDEGPSSLEAMYYASGGATVTHLTGLCYSGGCARFVPSQYDNTYAALGGFNFPPNTQRVHVRYLIYFGEGYVQNLITRHKHILIHRADDVSTHRGMTYIWNDGRGDFSVGACDNTDCRFEGDKFRPDGTEAYRIGEHLQEWVSIEASFDTSTHMIRVYVTTQDGSLNNYLLTERQIHSVDASLDYWTNISVLGAFIDLGTVPNPGMYWLMDEIVIDDGPIGPPAGFVTGEAPVHPRSPTMVD